MKFRLNTLVLLCLFSVLPVSAFANTWAISYGGPERENAWSAQQTADGGFILAGRTESYGSGLWDSWVVKLDSSGEVVWEKVFGASDHDEANSVQETSDGDFIVVGYTRYSISDALWDWWIAKLDASGDVIWQKTYGEIDPETAYSVQETSEGDFIVAGRTWSYGAGYTDSWVVRLDSSGQVIWQKAYGATHEEIVESVQETTDGGFIAAGSILTFDGMGWGYLFWVLRLDASGEVIWQKAYGGSADDSYARSIRETSDGGFGKKREKKGKKGDVHKFIS